MMLASLVALALAAAPDAATATADVKPAADAPKAKKTCYESKVSGSRLSRKTCVFSAPSKAEKEAAREEAEAQKSAAEAKPAA